MEPGANSPQRSAAGLILRAVVLLLLGAVVNVAVAWGCVRWSPTSPQSATGTIAFDKWRARTGDRRVWDSGIWEARIGWGVQHERINVNRYVLDAVGPGATISDDLYVARCGLPLYSMREFHRGWRLGSLVIQRLQNPKYHRRVPVDPIWSGFLINTFFYAAVLWLLLFAPGAARRRIRRRRGRCPQCGYDLRGQLAMGCSECGWDRQKETKSKIRRAGRQRDGETQ